MNFGEAILLGLVQGLTEFLPVSSSGHLVLARDLLGMAPAESPSFEIVVHLGTLLSVFMVMRTEVLGLLGALPRCLDRGRWRRSFAEDPSFRALVLLVPATLPVVLVGLLAKEEVEASFGRPALAAAMLLVTAALLLATRIARRRRERELDLRIAVAMGLAQALAILPGISRSGSTIAAGLLAGGERRRVGGFSFFMAIPAILGAVILEAREIGALDLPLTTLVAGFASAALVGALALALLLRLVRRGRLWIFAPYLVAAALGWLLVRG